MAWYRRGIWGLLICIPLLLLAEEGIERPIRFASQPMEGSKILHEQFYGLIGFLQNALNQSVEMADYPDLGRLRRAIRDDELDLAYLGPLAAALLMDADKALQPLACFREPDGEAGFTCSLVARGESRIGLTSTGPLRIAIPDSFSTCGGLALPEMLRQSGRRPDEPEIRIGTTGSHTEAALGVVRGEYDLALVNTAVAERYRHLDLQALQVSRRFPAFALYANGRSLTPDRIERLRQRLLALDPLAAEARPLRLSGWGESLRNGLSPPSECDLTGVSGSIEWRALGSAP